jgi:hypothetical protein
MMSALCLLDPLNGKFALTDLPRVAPWIYEEVAAIGVHQVKSAIASAGADPEAPQPMSQWVRAVTMHRSPIDDALATYH